MPLTDVEIRKVKPAEKLVKLADGGGLQLWVFPDGAKRWRLAYRFGGKQKLLAIGVYPPVPLVDARIARERARKLLADGVDPGTAKKAEKAKKAISQANTFETIAAELIAKKKKEGKSAKTIAKTEWMLGIVRPILGTRPIIEISSADVLFVLRPLETRGKLETAIRLRATIGQVFRYAIATARAENDPTIALRGALATPTVKHRAAIIEPKAYGALLRAISSYEGTPETRAGLELLALTFVRPGELRSAEWHEFDLERSVWEIPATKMKMRRPHRVPLASQAAKILKDLNRITGHGKFVFPSIRSSSRPMSENTLNAALRRLGFNSEDMSAHGFRSAASSMLNECGLWNSDAIEAQLAHADKDETRRAYHRADYWDERVKMMSYWADRCEAMRRGGHALPLSKTSDKSA